MTKIKFPVLNNVDYMDVTKNKEILKTYYGSDLDKLAWRDVQIKIGSDVGSEFYHYQLKFKNSDQLHKGLIRGVLKDGKTKNVAASSDIEKIKDSINQLNQKIVNVSSGGGVQVDLLIQVTRQSYETQINFLNAEINRRELLINKLENKIDDLETDLNECQETAQQSGGVSQYIEMAKMFLDVKRGNLKPIDNLKDSNINGIPQEILSVLGMVDYSQIPEQTLNEIINYLKIFIQKLPLRSN
ncbi:MAG: hypothetical protein IPM51_12115 [Sphingobacteriaceae bacterium]|nr:hypothetical protein [Sphingobacteriaceae bacterium]